MPLTYRTAGVDIEAGERLVDRIKPLAAATSVPEAMGGIGGFASLCALPQGLHDPVLVSGTDGVGTKLAVAFAADRHGSVGIDLVAMCANDVVTTGARPLFFLDYFGTGALDVERATHVVEGIAEGCKQAGCALLGGETAELPGMYKPGEYDLAGFVVGVVERAKLLTGESIEAGDTIIGVASNGLHSNGYSLARKVLLERAQLPLEVEVEELGEPLVDALLRPTRIYCRAALAACEAGGVRGLCHVTGGGLPGNLPRILPKGLGAELQPDSWERAPIFSLIERLGDIERDEMWRAFNMGLGMIAVVAPDRADAIAEALRAQGEQTAVVGRVVKMPAATGEARVRFL